MIMAKIITATILMITLICITYSAFKGIKNNDDKLTSICSISACLVGFLFGIILGSLIFN